MLTVGLNCVRLAVVYAVLRIGHSYGVAHNFIRLTKEPVFADSHTDPRVTQHGHQDESRLSDACF